jgi:hypothetical protein
LDGKQERVGSGELWLIKCVCTYVIRPGWLKNLTNNLDRLKTVTSKSLNSDRLAQLARIIMPNKDILDYSRWWPRFERGRCRIESRGNYTCHNQRHTNRTPVHPGGTEFCKVTLNMCGVSAQRLDSCRLFSA